MKITNYLFVFIFTLIFIQCQSHRQEMDPSSYLAWVKSDRSLKKEKQIGQFLYSLQYVPNDYSVLQGHNNLTKQGYDSLIRDYNHFMSFIFKVRLIGKKISPLKYNVSSNEEFSMKLQYCSYKISKDFYLVLGQDTLPCVNALLERDYNISPYNTFVLTFESDLFKQDKLSSDLLLVYDDYVWDNGIIKFRIKRTDLENIPKLKFI